MELPRVYSPRERLHIAGAARAPVGNSQITQEDLDSDIRERGLTYQLTIPNTSAEIFPVDRDRKFIFIQNNDALGRVTVSFGGAGAVLGVGFNLAANGGAILLDNNVPTARIFMIGSIPSNANVTVITG